MPTDLEIYDATVATCKEFVPKLKIISKEDSWLHRTIGKLLKVFGNPDYMERYYTTLGFTVGCPGKDRAGWRTLWHEAGHGLQAKKLTRFLFGALYLLGTPVYLVPALLFGWMFFVWLPWWAGLIFVLGCALVSFPPFGFFRAHWEFQMYGLSIAVRHWNGVAIDDEYIERRSKEFTKSFYFWMCPFPKYVKKRLKQSLGDAKSGALFTKRGYGKYYSAAYRTMKELSLVKSAPSTEPAN